MLTHARLLADLLPHHWPRTWQPSAEPRSADDAGAVPAPPAASAYVAARAALGRHEWRAAQRLLQVAVADDPGPLARADLDAVRRARKALDRLARWPSSADAHLALGVACFELELGEDALREFRAVQRLAPRSYEGFAMAALEHAYRRAYAPALEAWTRARALNPDLPDFSDVLAHLPPP
jgi:tetratricopeptide (TPR) repeat protein